jgi:hypothetical protein
MERTPSLDAPWRGIAAPVAGLSGYGRLVWKLHPSADNKVGRTRSTTRE